MNFSEHQVRNVFVANSIVAANTNPTVVGAISPCGITGKTLYFKQYGAAGPVCSPIMDIKKISKMTVTHYADICTKLKSQTITVNTAVPGQVYKVNLTFGNYLGDGNYDTLSKVAVYRAQPSDTAALIAAGLANAIKLATKDEGLVDVSVAGAVITLTEVEQPWVLGKRPVYVIPIAISIDSIQSNGEDVMSWATIADAGTTTTNDGIKKLADLEFFGHGTRGDIYRGMGYPHNIDTQYLINMASTYDVINIHYHYSGEGLESYHSEADLQILIPAGNTAILTAINTITGAAAGSDIYFTIPTP